MYNPNVTKFTAQVDKRVAEIKRFCKIDEDGVNKAKLR